MILIYLKTALINKDIHRMNFKNVFCSISYLEKKHF